MMGEMLSVTSTRNIVDIHRHTPCVTKQHCHVIIKTTTMFKIFNSVQIGRIAKGKAQKIHSSGDFLGR